MRQQQSGQVLVNSEEVKQIIRNENYELLVQRSEAWGQELKRQKLTRAQIRRIYNEVKRLQMSWDPVRLRMLKPRLAYIAVRQQQEARGGQLLRRILTPAIDAVFEARDEDVQQQRFKVLADLFEALLAYFYASERQGGR